MVRRYLFWSLAFLVLVGSRPALGRSHRISPATSSKTSALQNIAGNLNSSPVTVMNSPLDLGEASFIPANGWVSGWAVNNVQMSYNTVERHAVRRAGRLQERVRPVRDLRRRRRQRQSRRGILADDGDGRHRQRQHGWRQGGRGRIRAVQLDEPDRSGHARR